MKRREGCERRSEERTADMVGGDGSGGVQLELTG